MMVDVTDMRHIWPEIANHVSHPATRLCGIDCVRRLPGLCPQSRLGLEIDGWDEIPIVRGRLAMRIGHREQRYLVPPRAHQFHEFKQVNLGSTEWIVIFVAIQDSHRESPRSAVECGAGIDRKMNPDF